MRFSSALFSLSALLYTETHSSSANSSPNAVAEDDWDGMEDYEGDDIISDGDDDEFLAPYVPQAESGSDYEQGGDIEESDDDSESDDEDGKVSNYVPVMRSVPRTKKVLSENESESDSGSESESDSGSESESESESGSVGVRYSSVGRAGTASVHEVDEYESDDQSGSVTPPVPTYNRVSSSSVDNKKGSGAKPTGPMPIEGVAMLPFDRELVVTIPNYLENGLEVSLKLTSQDDREAADNQLWFARHEDTGRLFVIKMFFDLTGDGYEEIENEAAVLDILNRDGSGIFVRKVGSLSGEFQTLSDKIALDTEDSSDDGEADAFVQYGRFKYMVLERLGEPVASNSILIALGGKGEARRQIAYRLASESIRILQRLHELDYVHGDIHSGNLLYANTLAEYGRDAEALGGYNGSPIKLIDFGTTVRTPATYTLLPKREFVATHQDKNGDMVEGDNFSVMTPFEMRFEPYTKRDDLYRLGLVLVQALNCKRDMEASMRKSRDENIEMYTQRMIDFKLGFTPSVTCKMPYLRDSLDIYFRMVANLGFSDVPDYHTLASLFSEELSQTTVV